MEREDFPALVTRQQCPDFTQDARLLSIGDWD
jgi:hypothetical protein